MSNDESPKITKTIHIGPQLSKDSSFACYKKENSEVSLQSEQREKLNQPENQKLIMYKSSNPIVNIPLMSQNNDDFKGTISINKSNFLQFVLNKALVNKFISNLLQASYVLPKKFKFLVQENYISDEQQHFHQVLKKEQANQKIFQPSNHGIMYWNILGILINMISLWLSPFMVAFNYKSSKIVFIVIILFLLFDILVNFNRSTISQGEIINNRALIVKEYLKGNAFYDIFSLIIWVVNFTMLIDSIYFEVLQLLQIILTIKKVLTIFDNLFDSFYTKGIYTDVIDLVSLITSVYFFAHLMACIWFFVGEKSGQYLDVSWLRKLNLENESILIQYTYSIYWASTTIVTVGYGDITPQNYVEVTFATIMIIFSNFVYAYSLNSIGTILKNFQDHKYFFRKMIFRMNNFMKQNKVDLELQLRARNFLKYQLLEKEKQENQEEMNNILQKMPEGLRNAINKDVKMKILNEFSFLKIIFSSSIIKEIYKILEIVYLTPEEVLFLQGENSDQSLYYISQGKILLYENQSKKVLSVLTTGEKFGDYQFFTGLYPTISAKSECNSIVFKIQREKLLKIIKQSEKDFQRFNDIKDKILLYSDYSKCFSLCQLCKRYSHPIIECPLIQFKPNLEQRIKKQNFMETQNYRGQFKRKKMKLNSLINLQQIEQVLNTFKEENSILLRNFHRMNQINKKSLEEHSIPFDQDISLRTSNLRQQNQPSQKLLNPIQKQLFQRQQQSKPSLSACQIIQPSENINYQQNQTKSLNNTLMNIFTQTKSYQHVITDVLVDDQKVQFDCLKEFKYYMTHNNVTLILKRMDRKVRNKKSAQYSNLGRYSFSCHVKIMGIKMRKLFYQQMDQTKK